MPNLSTVSLILDTIPDGRTAGRPAGRTVWWRKDNSAKLRLGSELGKNVPMFGREGGGGLSA